MWKLCVILFIVLKGSASLGKDKEAYSQPSTLVKLMGELQIYHEISKFLSDAREKLETDCTTIVWDYKFSTILDNLKLCGDGELVQSCLPVYTVLYEDVSDFSNFTEGMVKTLKEGYRRQCGSYILILRSSRTVSELLHFGDDFRMINTRARFLIWYGTIDKGFEADDIWKKVPNAILFYTKLGKRARRRMTFTIKGFKWPVLPNVPDPTRVVDFWSQGKYFGRTVENWYRDRTTDLKNITLKILAVEHPPGVIKYEKGDDKVEYAGNEVNIVKELANIMNFNYEFLEVDSETKWGGQVSTNFSPQFSGAVARLIYGEADIAIGSFFVLKHYLDFLDMSIPLDVACTSFLTPNPLTRPRYLALILPFNYKLWSLVLSICLILAPLGLYMLAKLPLHDSEYSVFTHASQVVFTCFSIMSQVALHLWPKFWGVRMFIGWFWMFCLLISLAYRGAMVSFLTIPLFEPSIDNVNDLAASGLRLGGWGTELHRLFKQYTSTNGHTGVKSILRDRYEMIEDTSTAISWVAQGDFALYENIRFLKFTRQTRNLTKFGYPSMRIMKQCIVPVHIGIAYQKNSPIVPTINRYIRRFQESGLIKRWSQRLVTRTKLHYQKIAKESLDAGGSEHSEENSEEEEEEESESGEAAGSSSSKQRKQRVLNMKDLQGSVYLIFFGFFLSATAFIAEIFVAKSRMANSELLKKLKDKTGMKVGEETNEENGGPSKKLFSLSKLVSKSESASGKEAFLSRNQLIANMLMEYDAVVKRTERKIPEENVFYRKLDLRRKKVESVRVKTSDNRDEYFRYME